MVKSVVSAQKFAPTDVTKLLVSAYFLLEICREIHRIHPALRVNFMDEPQLDNELVKAILTIVDTEERSDYEYRASTKQLIEKLSDYDASKVGALIESLVDNERLLEGRDYPPREGETFKFYVRLNLTMRGHDRLAGFNYKPPPYVEVDLFD